MGLSVINVIDVYERCAASDAQGLAQGMGIGGGGGRGLPRKLFSTKC